MNSDMQIASPEVTLDIDRDRALALGVTPQQIQNALASSFGSREVSTIYAPANQYSVILETKEEYQRSPEALSKLYLRSSQGTLTPLDSVVRTKRTIGPLNINHFGQLPAVTISFNLKPGFSLSQAADQVDNVDPRKPNARIDNHQLPRHCKGVSEIV